VHSSVEAGFIACVKTTDTSQQATTLAAKQDRLGLTPAEFAALFGRKPTWGYRKLYSGEIRRLQSPGRILIPVSEINRFASKTVQHG